MLLVVVVALIGASQIHLGWRPAIEGTFHVGAHDIYLSCHGRPAPTVLFEAAIGGDRTLWPIAERVRDSAFTCVYDRAGTGQSSSVDHPMDAREYAEELHALLMQADVPRPIRIVAHSYGALVTLVEASAHPEDVAGVMFIDGSHPRQEIVLESVMDTEQRAQFRAQNQIVGSVDLPRSLDEAAAAYRTFPDIPLTVLTATAWRCESSGLPCEQMRLAWRGLQNEYATLTTHVRHIEVDADHYIQNEKPDLVVSEVLALVAATPATSSGSP